MVDGIVDVGSVLSCAFVCVLRSWRNEAEKREGMKAWAMKGDLNLKMTLKLRRFCTFKTWPPTLVSCKDRAGETLDALQQHASHPMQLTSSLKSKTRLSS